MHSVQKAMGKTHYQELILCLHGKITLHPQNLHFCFCNNVPSVKRVKEAQEARRGNQGREVTQNTTRNVCQPE
jgi:hypothetical protein